MENSNPFISLNPKVQQIEEGISLITAIKNRKETFEVALSTWINHDQIDEIVIVDWSSDESLKPLIEKYQNGKIILAIVGDQPKWILSHAFNLAARLSSKSKILKMDADVKILPGFFEYHTLVPGTFFAGNWRIARNENEKHLNGISFVHRENFFKVNGYNEFIKTYGWDDIDLYARLESLPITRKNIDHDFLFHMEHLNRISFQDHMDFLLNINDTEKSILNSLVNRFLTESFRKWSVDEQMLSFLIDPIEDHIICCKQNQEDKNVVPAEIMEKCESLAIVERFYEMGVNFSKDLLCELNRNELIDLLILFFSQSTSNTSINIFNTFLTFNKKYIEKANEIASLRLTILNNEKQKPANNLANQTKQNENVLPTKFFEFFIKKKFTPKFNLDKEVGAFYGEHRSGWSFAIGALVDLHNPEGIKLDSFIERTFQWHPDGIHPHLEPWVGFIHVPALVPAWFAHEVSNEAIFSSTAWRESIPFCKGIYTLSNYHKKVLQQQLVVPINNLIHPTEDPPLKWDWNRFIRNKERKVVQVGFWLRKLYSIHLLKAPAFQKCFLRKENVNIDQLLILERENCELRSQITDEVIKTTTVLTFLPGEEYDILLTENIVFLDLYDASANNTIIECIVRGTPVLVNPIEAVVEYLGTEYPFYFNDLTEAAAKLADLDLVYKTYQYLQDLPIKKKLTPKYFKESVVQSPIYQSL